MVVAHGIEARVFFSRDARSARGKIVNAPQGVMDEVGHAAAAENWGARRRRPKTELRGFGGSRAVGRGPVSDVKSRVGHERDLWARARTAARPDCAATTRIARVIRSKRRYRLETAAGPSEPTRQGAVGPRRVMRSSPTRSLVRDALEKVIVEDRCSSPIGTGRDGRGTSHSAAANRD